MNFKTYLEEGRDAPLYHATSLNKALNIIKQGEIKAYKEHGDTILGVSLTRNFKFAVNWNLETEEGAIFELDQRKLSQRHKIKAHNFFSKKKSTRYPENANGLNPQDMNEYEERIMGSVKNVDKYISKIHIDHRDYTYYKKLNDTFYEKIITHPLLFVKGKFVNA